MKDEYDFRHGKRGAVIPQPGKTRITIYIDNDVLEAFRSRAESSGTGYQTMMNQTLREYLDRSSVPVDEASLRRVLREELQRVMSPAGPHTFPGPNGARDVLHPDLRRSPASEAEPRLLLR